MDIESELQEYQRVRKLYAETHPDRDFAADVYCSRMYWRNEAERWCTKALLLGAACLLLVVLDWVQ